MFHRLRGFFVPIAVLAVLGFASASRAETVSYTASGSFSAGGTDAIANGSAAFKVGNKTPSAGSLVAYQPSTSNPDLSLTFASAGAQVSDPLNTLFSELGEFTLNFDVKNLPVSFSNSSLFNLTVNQTSPSGVANSSATIAGSISYTGSGTNLDTGTIKIHFAPNPVVFTADNGRSYRYTFNDVLLNVTTNQPGTVMGTLSANISAVPLPGVAVGGLWLLGGVSGIGSLKSLRRRMSASIV